MARASDAMKRIQNTQKATRAEILDIATNVTGRVSRRNRLALVYRSDLSNFVQSVYTPFTLERKHRRVCSVHPTCENCVSSFLSAPCRPKTVTLFTI
jgi:hypothetical protein